ncbi:NAD-dependent malic enzyme, mitochondrial [Cryptotrichosporon argae]
MPMSTVLTRSLRAKAGVPAVASTAKRALTSKIITSPDQKNLVPIRTNLRGSALLNNSRLNKGAGFTRDERQVFGLESFLPYDVHSLDKQIERAYQQLLRQATADRAETLLFYALMQKHLKETINILYTPGVAEAVANYSTLFRRPTGCFISYPNHDGMRAQLEAQLEDVNRTADVAYNAKETQDAIDLVVITDSEGVLGIGDQGVGGIAISLAKSALYTLGAGVNPNRILPVVLDVGTDNHALFSSSLYMGWKRQRLRGKNYDAFIDKFINHCRELFVSHGAAWHGDDARRMFADISDTLSLH